VRKTEAIKEKLRS